MITPSRTAFDSLIKKRPLSPEPDIEDTTGLGIKRQRDRSASPSLTPLGSEPEFEPPEEKPSIAETTLPTPRPEPEQARTGGAADKMSSEEDDEFVFDDSDIGFEQDDEIECK